MEHVDLLATNDAIVWAEEFVKSMKKNKWSLDDIDEGLMVGWFAHAMCAQETVMIKKIGNMGIPSYDDLYL